MRIFQKDKKYKIECKNSNNKIKIYTAKIIDEDSYLVKFSDIENNIILINKDRILEATEK